LKASPRKSLAQLAQKEEECLRLSEKIQENLLLLLPLWPKTVVVKLYDTSREQDRILRTGYLSGLYGAEMQSIHKFLFLFLKFNKP
jgi:hypothetical protein